MSQETKPTIEQTELEKQVQVINQHLDALMGMDVRKPGSAAKLPAVIRITETLEAAGGKDFPVFPPSYAGDGSPVYDLNGIEWGQREMTLAKGDKKIVAYVKSARHCTMDSPQSHANRTEIAFVKDPTLRGLVPKVTASYPRDKEIVGSTGTEEVDVLTLPHRIADFRIRASKEPKRADDAIKEFSNGDALPLLRLMPTSIIFGFWDSRAEGYQHKHRRILLTRIDAFNVVPCERHAVYVGPYSKTECAAVVVQKDEIAAESWESEKELSKSAARWAKAMAERGFCNALSKPNTPGGVFAERIERLALISLTDIASVFCFKPAEKPDKEAKAQAPEKPEPDKNLTNAARRYLLALALLAENYPRSTGSYNLRSGCELIAVKKEPVLRGAGADSEAAKAVMSLCGNSDLLISVAEHARGMLGILPCLDQFQSDADSLRSYLGKDIKTEKDAEKEMKARVKAAQKETDDAAKAPGKATKAAETKANLSQNDKDKTTAEKRRQDVSEPAAKANELEKAAELSAKPGQPPEPPSPPEMASPAEPQPPTPEA